MTGTPGDGWRDPGRVTEYLSRAIPHRDIAEAMLLQALPAGLERFIDLGTGDGRLIGLIREQHPDARYGTPMAMGIKLTLLESLGLSRSLVFAARLIACRVCPSL